MDSIVYFLMIIISAAACAVLRQPEPVCIVLGVCIAGMFLASVFFHYRREKQLAELTAYLTRLQDQLTLPDLARCRSGQFGILESEIYKLVVLISEQRSASDRET